MRCSVHLPVALANFDAPAELGPAEFEATLVAEDVWGEEAGRVFVASVILPGAQLFI
jgi:hypothetical protein